MSETSRNATSSPASGGGPTPSSSPGGEIALSGPEAVPVGRGQLRGRDWGQRTLDISGPSGFASSKSADLQRSLESRLRDRLALGGSTLFSLTWKEWVLPSGRPICALRALARPMPGRASSGWQTPTTRDGKGQSGAGNRTRRGRNGKLHVANLCDQLVDIGRPDLVRSTTFRCLLMGYPLSWERARATGMLLSPKSRRRSSKPTSNA